MAPVKPEHLESCVFLHKFELGNINDAESTEVLFGNSLDNKWYIIEIFYVYADPYNVRYPQIKLETGVYQVQKQLSSIPHPVTNEQKNDTKILKHDTSVTFVQFLYFVKPQKNENKHIPNNSTPKSDSLFSEVITKKIEQLKFSNQAVIPVQQYTSHKDYQIYGKSVDGYWYVIQNFNKTFNCMLTKTLPQYLQEKNEEKSNIEHKPVEPQTSTDTSKNSDLEKKLQRYWYCIIILVVVMVCSVASSLFMFFCGTEDTENSNNVLPDDADCDEDTIIETENSKMKKKKKNKEKKKKKSRKKQNTGQRTLKSTRHT
jgi:hypothetical protein